MSQRHPRFVATTTTIGSAVSDACSELESLAGEMRDWYDNMPENFQNGDKGSMVDECANSLENVTEPEVPEFLEGLPVTYNADRKARSRAARCGDCISMLEAVVEFLDGHLELYGEGLSEAKQEERDEAESFRDEVQTIIDEIQGVEFPGMYG